MNTTLLGIIQREEEKKIPSRRTFPSEIRSYKFPTPYASLCTKYMRLSYFFASFKMKLNVFV